MSNSRRSLLKRSTLKPDTKNVRRIHWFAGLAVLGTLLLFLGASWSSAAPVDDRLASLVNNLKEQGKQIRSAVVVETGAGAQIVIECANGEVRKYTAKGQLVEVKDAQSRVTTYQNGLEIEQKDAEGAVISQTQYVRDSAGKLREAIKRSGAGVEDKLFDDQGNVIQVSDAQGNRTYGHYEKGRDGRTLSYLEIDQNTGKTSRVVLNPRSGEVSEKYDENGIRTAVETVRDAKGDVSQTTERDQNGNVTIKKFADGRVLQTIKNGVVTDYENRVGANGQLQETRERTAVGANLVVTVTKKYDATGRVVVMQDAQGVHNYVYVLGANGKLAARQERITGEADGVQVNKRIVTSYDENGRIASVEDGNKQTSMAYTVDAHGNLLGQTETKTVRHRDQTYSETIASVYDGKGHLQDTTNEFGQRTTYGYDAKGNRKSVDTATEHTEFVYDGSNVLRTSMTKDKKSITQTAFEKDGKLAAHRDRVYKDGFVETTVLSDGAEGKRVAVTTERFGIKLTVFLNREGEQPLKTLLVKYNGRVVTTDYSYDRDQLVSSHQVDFMGYTDIQYNFRGKPESQRRTDLWGRTFDTYYTYKDNHLVHSTQLDAKGKTETDFDADENAVTIARINTIGFPRESVETRSYTDGLLISSRSSDEKGITDTEFGPGGLASKVHRVNFHGFPRENTIVNQYDPGGDLVQNQQSDSRGETKNDFDMYGLVSASVRKDSYGFPKDKTTTYTYQGSDLASSDEKDSRGTTHNRFNQDGLMVGSQRTKLNGYPRIDTSTFVYNDDGYLIAGHGEDLNGTSDSEYNIDELMVKSTRHNLHGHARDQETTFTYDAEGFLTASDETDLKTAAPTHTVYNRDGLAISSLRQEKYGPNFSRITQSVNEYDSDGFLVSSISKNPLGTNESRFDLDGLVRWSQQVENYGLLGGKTKTSDTYVYDAEGHIGSNVETDQLGTSYNTFDREGDPVQNLRVANYGLMATRTTTTLSIYDPDTGLITDSISTNAYGTTTGDKYDPVTGLVKQQTIMANFGIGYTRVTSVQLTPNDDTGLNQTSVSTNEMGETFSSYDPQYGTLDWSDTANNYGLGYGKHSYTMVNAFNQTTGINIKTTTINSSEQKGAGVRLSQTITDQYDPDFGTPLHQHTTNYFGVLLGRENDTLEMDVNSFNGLNEKIVSANALATTTTLFDGNTTGTFLEASSDNTYGLRYAKHSRTTLVDNGAGGPGMNYDTGLQRQTYMRTSDASGAHLYSETWTDYDDVSGVPMFQRTCTQFGLAFSRQTDTTLMDVNANNGLNREIDAINDLTSTVSLFDDKKYGTLTDSDAENAFGLGFARHSYTHVDEVNQYTGFNIKTTTTSSSEAWGHGQVLSTTTTYQFNADSGTPEAQFTDSNYGIGLAKHTQTTHMDVNQNNGLNHEIDSTNDTNGRKGMSSEIISVFDQDTYGTLQWSRAANNYGLGFGKYTYQIVNANQDTGLNNSITTINSSQRVGQGEKPVSNILNTTVTDYDPYSGTAMHQITTAAFGVMDARVTETSNMDVNQDTGLNRETETFNDLGFTQSIFDDAATGVMLRSDTENYFGTDDSRHTYTEVGDGNFSTDTGFNIQTVTTNSSGAWGTGTVFSRTTTTYDQQTGLADHQKTVSNFGVNFARTTETTTDGMKVNTDNGLNQEIVTANQMATTTTEYDDQQYGTFKSSKADSNYGLAYTRHVETKLDPAHPGDAMNTNNGLQRYTVTDTSDATGAYLYSETHTTYDDELGIPLTQHTENTYGVLNSRKNDTTIEADLSTGMNYWTETINLMGTTDTYFDPTYGTVKYSLTTNTIATGYAVQTATTVNEMNYDTGFQKKTTAVNSDGGVNVSSTVTTTYDDAKGIPTSQVTDNNFGRTDSRHTWTNYMKVDDKTGLNTEMQTENNLTKTTTFYNDAGEFLRSSTFNKFNLFSNLTTSYDFTQATIIDHTTGLRQETYTVNSDAEWGTGKVASKTATYYDSLGLDIKEDKVEDKQFWNVDEGKWVDYTVTLHTTITNDQNTGLPVHKNIRCIDSRGFLYAGLNADRTWDEDWDPVSGEQTYYTPGSWWGWIVSVLNVKGVALGGSATLNGSTTPSGKKHALALLAQPAVPTAKAVQAAAVSAAPAAAANGKASAGLPGAIPAATAKEQKQERTMLNAVLVFLLKHIQGLSSDQAQALSQAALEKLNAAEVAAVLQGEAEGVAKLLQAFIATYQVVLGRSAPGTILDDILWQVQQLIQMDPARIMELSQAGTTGQVLAASAGSGAALGAVSSGAGRTVAGAETAGVQSSSRLTAGTNPSDAQPTSSQGLTPASTSGPSTRNGAVEIEILSTGIRRTLFLNEDSDQARDVELFKFNGNIVRTHNDYVNGKLALRTETDVLQGATTQTQYNANERPTSSVRVDAWGQITTTRFSYSAAGKLVKSNLVLMRGHQLMASTVTNYDANEDATTITCDRTTGFKRHSVETRTYENHIPKTFTITDNQGRSTGTFNNQGMVHTLHRVDTRGVLRVSDTTYAYDVSGDLTQAVTTDARGTTIQKYDYTGLVTFSERVETRGYPRVTYTSNVYAQGVLSYAVSENDQGTRTVSYYDANGLVQKSVKTRRFGYPRTETTSGYAYDASGFLVSNVVTDERGTTALNYNYDGLAVAGTRHNLHGHGGDQALSYIYDAVGIMTKSSAVDALGTGRTDTVYNVDGLAWQVTRTSTYGLEGERSTLTTNTYAQGILTDSVSTNELGHLDKEYDKNGLATRSTLTRAPAYGLGREQVQITDKYTYDAQGLVTHSEGHDSLAMSTTSADYDVNGDPVSTTLSLKVGLRGERVTTTVTKYDAGTGLPIHSEAKNAMRTTTCDVFDAVTGQPYIQQVVENYGPELGKNRTETVQTAPKNGLKLRVTSSSDLEDKTTEYDTLTNGTYGIPSKWHINKKYGFAAERAVDTTRVDVNVDSGVMTFAREESTVQGAWWRETTYDPQSGATTLEAGGTNYGRVGERTYQTTFSKYDRVSGLPLESVTTTSLGTTTKEFDADTDLVTHIENVENGVTTESDVNVNDAGIVIGSDADNGLRKIHTVYDQSCGAKRHEEIHYYQYNVDYHKKLTDKLSIDWSTRKPTLAAMYLIRDYVDNGLAPFSTAANITYAYYEGVVTGAGTETYDATTGLIATRTLNTDAGNQFMKETITYVTDGNYTTSATGVREDGVQVQYTFTPKSDEILTSVDDKGTTTWNHGLRATTAGKGITYTYQYNTDNTLNDIAGTTTRGESLTFDKYFNLTYWRDADHVEHNFSCLTQNKGYWTSANDTFRDRQGTNWVGTIQYDAWGFYFKQETLVAKGIMLSDTAEAANLPVNIKQDLYTQLETKLLVDNRQRDTFTWTGSTDYGARTNHATLGQLMCGSQSLRVGNQADAEITIGADGSTQAQYSNVNYSCQTFYQQSRYKPQSSVTHKSLSWVELAVAIGVSIATLISNPLLGILEVCLTWGLIQSADPGQNSINWSLVNNAFYNGDCGSQVDSSWDITGFNATITHYTKADDGWQWTSNGRSADQTFTQTSSHSLNQQVQTPFDESNHYLTDAPKFVPATGQGLDQSILVPTDLGRGVRIDGTGIVNSTVSLQGLLDNGHSSATTGTEVMIDHAAPIGTGGMIDGGVIDHAAPIGVVNLPQGVALGGGGGTMDRNAVGDGDRNAVGTEGMIMVRDAAVQGAIAGGANGKAHGVVADTQAQLASGLTVPKTLVEVWPLVTLALGQLNQKEMLAVLQGSSESMAKLVKAVTKTYESMFGAAYDRSLLNQVTDQVKQLIHMDPVKILLLGQEGADAAPATTGKKAAGDVLSRDEEGRPLEVVDAKGAHHTFAYDDSGETETITDRQGKVVVKHSDANGRLLSESRDGRSYMYSYATDKTGATQTTVQETGADGTKTYQYDARQRLTQIASQGQKKTFAYEGVGKDEKVTETTLDEKGKLTERKTYQGGRLIKQEDADRTTGYAYSTDKKGEVTGMTMTVTEKGQDQTPTVMTYDGNGRMTSAQGPEAERYLKEQANLSLEKQALQLELEQVPQMDQKVQGQRVQEQLQQVH